MEASSGPQREDAQTEQMADPFQECSLRKLRQRRGREICDGAETENFDGRKQEVDETVNLPESKNEPESEQQGCRASGRV